MIIRKALINDIPYIIDMAIKLWGSHDKEELIQEFVGFIENPNSVVFIAVDDELPIAFVYSKLRFDYVEGTSTSPVGYLEGIFVEEEFRNQGLALKLLEASETWAKEQGAFEFASDCEISNKTSLEFHLKTGFTEANRIICFTKKL